MKSLALLLFLCCSLPVVTAIAETHEMKTAKVISQNIGSYNGGSVVMPMGTGLVGVPITRRENIVVIETASRRATLSDLGNVKHPLILPVNDTVNFYVEGSAVVILDSSGKKHKFGVVHIEAINAK